MFKEKLMTKFSQTANLPLFREVSDNLSLNGLMFGLGRHNYYYTDNNISKINEF